MCCRKCSVGSKAVLDIEEGFSEGKEIVLANEIFLICGKGAQVQVIRMSIGY